MSWFKENTFLAGLSVITALLAALIIFFGMKAGKSLEEKKSLITSKEATVKKDKSLNPYPTAANAKAKEESVKAAIAKGMEAREKLLAFLPESLDDIPAKDFSAKLTETVDKVSALFPAEKALPSGFFMGFKKYRGSQARENATGELNYQLGAMEYLLTTLSESGGKQIENLVRETFPVEDGKDWPDAPGAKMSFAPPKLMKRPPPGTPLPPTFEKLPAVAHRMPIELTFRAPEPVITKFLTEIANSEKYFFQTRIARVFNPAPLPSAGAGASDEGSSGGAFGDIEIEGDDPEPGEPVKSVKILDKVSGGEDLVVYLRADLLLFIKEKTLPELN